MKTATRFGLLGVACAALLSFVPPVQAVRIAPPAPGIRVGQAHTIIVGKVESIEEKTVSAKQFPTAKEKVEYQIAVVKIDDPILGAKGLTHVRVGFIPPPPPPMGKPGGPVLIRPRLGNVTFTKDQEGLFFLIPHPDGNFMIVQSFNDYVNKQGNMNFEKEVTETKQFVKMLTNPKESLQAEKQADRFTAAAVLMTHYRTKRLSNSDPKTETVDDDISKLILTSLGEADWKGPGAPGLFRMNPQMIFNLLDLKEQDGFTPPTMEVQGRKQIDYNKLADYSKQWCKDNAGKYKIQRLVYEEKQEKSDK